MSVVTPEYLIVNSAQLYRECVTYCAAKAPTVSVVFGRRALTQQPDGAPNVGARLCFIPGDWDGGRAGQYGGPVVGGDGTGLAPSAIGSRIEMVSIQVWGWDNAHPTDEAYQYDAVIAAEDVLLRSLRLSAMGLVKYLDPQWVVEPVEIVFGAAKWVRCLLQVPILATAGGADTAFVQPAAPAVGDVPVFENFAPGHAPEDDEQAYPVGE